MATNRVPYRTSLRVLGRLLNGDKARMVTVCEIDDGFLLHYFAQGNPCRVNSRAIHSSEVLDLDDLLHGQRGKLEPDGSLKGLQSVLGFRQSEALKFQKSHPLCPMGYENALRALGETLDSRHAQALMIHELDDSIQVEYTIDRADFVLREGVRVAVPGRREERYTAGAVDALVRKCREHTAEKVRRNGQNLSYNPMDVASYLDTAQTLEDDGHHRDAEDLYHKAMRLAPTHPEAHFGLARLAKRRGDHKGALKALQAATKLDPANGRYLHLLARLHSERERFEDAVASLRQAVAAEPGNRMYLFDLSRAYDRLGRHEEASAVLARYGAGMSARAVSRDPAMASGDASRPAAERRTGGRVQGARQAVHSSSAVTNDTGVTPAPLRNQPAPREVGLEDPSEPPVSGGLAAVPSLPEGAGVLQRRMADAGGGNGLPPESATLMTSALPLQAPPLTATTTPFAAEPPPWDSAPSRWTRVDPLPPAGAEVGLGGVGAAAIDDSDTAPMGASGAARHAVPAPHDGDAVLLAASIMRAEELARAEPHRADLHRKLGFLLAKQGRSEEAAAEFRRAVECGRRRFAQ